MRTVTELYINGTIYIEKNGRCEASNDFKCKWKDLMQYSGLKDKNGKKIYVGDIIRYEMDGIIYTQECPGILIIQHVMKGVQIGES